MDSTREGFPATRLGRVLAALEYVWAGLMCAEIGLRVVASGLVLPRGAFLRSGGWGWERHSYDAAARGSHLLTG